MSSQETLMKYYEALSIGDLDTVADCMDIPSKFISLYGVVEHASREDVIETYRGIIDSWNAQGISNKIGYKAEEFEVTRIQKNAELIKTSLSNFDLSGNFLQTWDCTYVLRFHGGKWLISLGTTNNERSVSMK